ncbi:MAG: universal stress protein [Betaproteobacteria bacterium]
MVQLFTRLLLATEHTEFDTGAEKLALAMAARCKLPLAAVLPLVSNPEYEALAPQVAARSERDAAGKIARLRAQADAAAVVLDVHLRRGQDPYREIVDEARDQKADLLIIRRRGKRSFLANLLVGEMVAKVVAHAPCPVLIVPRDARMWSRRVLVAAEPGGQGRDLVATALALAAECGLPLQLLVLVAEPAQPTAPDAFVADMLSLARKVGVAALAEVQSAKAASAILDCADRSLADLIVIARGGEGDDGRAVAAGMAQKVVGLSEYPVLVLHPSAMKGFTP